MQHPPERVDLGRLLLRRPTHADAEVIAAAVAAELERLADWMPWATEAATGVDAQLSRLTEVADQWDSGDAYQYLVVAEPFDPVVLLGVTALERRVGPGALELGYWLTGAAEGRGYMTSAAGALTEIGLGLPGIERIEIHCDQANLRSAAVARRLGYRLERVEKRELDTRRATAARQIWVTP